ncbi:hypothetical protein [Arthrobacter alpinus]|uniref:hypothetical protein n=1 Tax=Arthrobacter alpinus TaxID=656366 RepID=UPI0012FC6F82|nr:hypothetical protein [Arthrobacter alpinus]
MSRSARPLSAVGCRQLTASYDARVDQLAQLESVRAPLDALIVGGQRLYFESAHP